MTVANTFPRITHTGVPLAPMTSFGIGGIAKQFVQPRTVEELVDVLAHLTRTGTRYRVLGRGTNLLIKSREISEPVLHLGKMHGIRFDGEKVRAQSGMLLERLVTQCGERGLAGLETLAGIPGSVGGAVMMNAGGRYGWIGEVVSEVTCVDSTGLKTLAADKICFTYRNSSLRGMVVAEVVLALKAGDSREIAARRRDTRAEKKRGQPLAAKSAGCAFRNPPGGYAGQLIEAAGLKGLRVGGAMVSPLHANFIVNTGDASADDVLRLIERIRKKILENYKVILELELEIW